MLRSVLAIFCICLLSGCYQPKPSDYTLHVNIEDWTHKFEPQATKSYPVEVSNRMRWDLEGELHVHILQKKDTLNQFQRPCSIPKDVSDTVWVELVLPKEEGVYEIVASIVAPDGHMVKSRRIIEVEKPFVLPE